MHRAELITHDLLYTRRARNRLSSCLHGVRATALGMRLERLAIALFLPLAASAQDAEGPPRPPPRQPVDESPTHYACTLDLLLRGERCTFEFTPAPGQASEALARDNSQAAAMAARFCPEAATPRDEHGADPTLRKMCEDEVARVALDSCALEGRIPLRDAQGRVAVGAAECVDSLGRALARTRTMAGFSLGCCRCLAGTHCQVSAPQCNREMVDLSPGDELQSCLDKSCKSACSALQREEPLSTPASPIPPPTQRPRKAGADPGLKI